jgi:myo-inositol catabolism protein IolC
MDLSKLGYTKPLYILPFDHRATFAKKMFDLPSEKELSDEQKHLIAEFKMLIYKGFKDAVEKVIPADYAAILCDEEYGSAVLADAQLNGFITMLTLEKSGETEFKFAFDNFEEHIRQYHPIFAKVLIKFNPSDAEDLKKRQRENLKLVSDFCYNNGYKFLLELLVIPTEDQLKEVNGSKDRYDREMRTKLTIDVIKDLQSFSVEPDIWKLEGFETVKDYEDIVNVIKTDGRKDVNLVVLGRGATDVKVDEWLKTGAKVEWLEVGPKIEGVIGFAVGRTIFWDALEKFYKKEIGKAEVIQTVSENFQKFYKVFASLS